MANHYASCNACKIRISELLAELFGPVRRSWDLDLLATVEGWRDTIVGDALSVIYEALQKHRGYKHFVRRRKLQPVDYFVPSCGIIVEFDESQHFTRPREISLAHYSQRLQLGFSLERWQSLCRELNRRDNDTAYRDEQRAWYDTLRDFAPDLLSLRPTVRIYARDRVWCKLNPQVQGDLLSFKQIIEGGGRK